MKSLIIATLIGLSATAAHATAMDIHCTAGDAVVSAQLNIEGKVLTGTIQANGAGIEDFNAAASGNYMFYPAGTYYKYNDLEIIEFWGASGKNSVAFKSVRGEGKDNQEHLFINKQDVGGTCVVSKE